VATGETGLASAGRPRIAALGDTGGLAGAAAQIIKLGAAHDTAADNFDRLDVRAVQREHALHAFAEADLANGKGGAQPAVGAGDADAFVILNAGALAFHDAHADAQRIARAEFRDRLGGGELLDGFGFQRLNEIHLLLVLLTSPRARGRRLRDATAALDQVRPP
jgi:hypothetical protein